MSEEDASHWQVVRAERHLGVRVSVTMADRSRVVGLVVDVTKRKLVLDTGQDEHTVLVLAEMRRIGPL